MDLSAILFASASLPILLFNAFWYREERNIEGAYGIFSGIFALSGALLVTAGFPGNLVLPITFSILSVGSIHAYLKDRKRSKVLRASIFIAITAAIIVLEALL